MKILNRDRDRDIEKWMECPHKKIVLNKGAESCSFTDEGLKRYADIKGCSVDSLFYQLNIHEGWFNDYVVHHSKVQCDPDFISLVENNPKEVIFSRKYYDPVVRDLSNYKSDDKLIVVYEQVGHEGLLPSETLYEYEAYMDITTKITHLEAQILMLKYSLKEVGKEDYLWCGFVEPISHYFRTILESFSKEKDFKHHTPESIYSLYRKHINKIERKNKKGRR